MPDFAHIANSIANDPLASLLLAIPISFALIVLSSRIWWVHGPFAVLLLAVSILFQSQRNLAFDSFLVGLFAFPPLCRDIPNQPLLFRIGIFWFSAFALVAAAIYAAGDRAQPATPSDKLHVDRAPPAVTIERTT
ncbi:hypothetical protein EN858_29860 [Mesorhizobium sp. M4B.F.Ca.ET.215.01.1.1]|uniref:hypothetical protein n=1 Tax=unclassified Mesorhizobium TaxID=325217 RepID=UPI000FE7B798|nr:MULTISPECIES: hypothetical protein [unclassified Mesorhizobium]RWC82907.1 MAG: hypothetical protein EOS31_14200 [Mesorhizobium sp.]TGQ05222.1 hypothetical protein EN858_29860 [Mesorhizobium sp. M4B.F.Ca.ET.215.01.1.1]TGQ30527.1 hypothetical protein EN863_040710 [Mesorhizobium sp. M00.F.Ca.ET.220.01.1.1]TGQ97768.1 hypothetical protein EN846_28100 [Mesorhizobium sp. M4B.F.Ca.ET.203.01.1.1]TIV38402.1 MAG: hypothetical protein E5V91_14745 [Mesorhizobium sp.]